LAKIASGIAKNSNSSDVGGGIIVDLRPLFDHARFKRNKSRSAPPDYEVRRFSFSARQRNRFNQAAATAELSALHKNYDKNANF
jgi:hypothetical protein